MGRGRPKKDATIEKEKKERIEQIQENLKVSEEAKANAEKEIAKCKAQLKIEELDDNVKAKLLKKQDAAVDFIRCITTFDEINDVLNKLGIEVSIMENFEEKAAEEPAEESGEKPTEELLEESMKDSTGPLNKETAGTSEENS